MTEDLAEIVRIVPLTFGARAECSCGWRGKRRWHTSGAMLDAVEHGKAQHAEFPS